MYNCYISFRNAFINKFHFATGYLLMVICMFTTFQLLFSYLESLLNWQRDY